MVFCGQEPTLSLSLFSWLFVNQRISALTFDLELAINILLSTLRQRESTKNAERHAIQRHKGRVKASRTAARRRLLHPPRASIKEKKKRATRRIIKSPKSIKTIVNGRFNKKYHYSLRNFRNLYLFQSIFICYILYFHIKFHLIYILLT